MQGDSCRVFPLVVLPDGPEQGREGIAHAGVDRAHSQNAAELPPQGVDIGLKAFKVFGEPLRSFIDRLALGREHEAASPALTESRSQSLLKCRDVIADR